jgi:hypothetical protein
MEALNRSETMRGGKLFINPLHLLVEEVQLSEVK